MSNPTAQQPVKPAGAATFDPRRLPTAWFLAAFIDGFGHDPRAARGHHCYVSRTEDGLYRVWARGLAMLLTEGVARRHLRRVPGQDGSPVRVRDQRRWGELWSETYYARRTAA